MRSMIFVAFGLFCWQTAAPAQAVNAFTNSGDWDADGAVKTGVLGSNTAVNAPTCAPLTPGGEARTPEPPFEFLGGRSQRKSEERVMEALERLMRGRTVIMIAHRLNTLRRADKVIVLKDGIVAEEGSPEHLLETGGVYAGLREQQARSAEALG